ncbi:MAG: hypothetical protein AMXMBFR36_26480 [Acidobacteriota bacterium]
MKHASTLAAALGSAALGAGLMYLLDPDLGARRRVRLRREARRVSRRGAAFAIEARRTIANPARLFA